MAERRSRWADAVVAAVVWAGVVLVVVLFVWVVADLVWHGLGRISWAFLTDPPRKAGTAGGIGPMIVSTALILLVCLAAALPLALGTAILLAEFAPAHGAFGRGVRGSLDVLAGVPSIVFGLFGNALFCKVLGLGFSILAGGLTLACMVLPILIRAIEEGLRAVPEDYRLGAAALGLSRTSTLWHILLPAAVPGLAVGLVLGLGRALAETAALIFTSGYVDRMPDSPFDSGRSLSIHIYDLEMNVPGGETNAYATALVLLGAMLALSGLASWLAERWLGRRVLPV